MIDDVEVPLFPGVYAIFGHGNVTSLGLALQEAGDAMPTWRGQNEQGMGLAAVGFAKARNRRQIMVATSSIGPGALNMVTAAGVAHANRLPVLFLAGDTFASRLARSGAAAGRALRGSDRSRQRRVQVGQSLLGSHHASRADHPLAAARRRRRCSTPPTAGRPLLALPQDVQAEAFDFPDEFFATTVHHMPRPQRRPRPTGTRRRSVEGRGAAVDHRRWRSALLAARGGAGRVRRSAQRAGRRDGCRAGRACRATHPMNAGPVGVTGLHQRQRVGRRRRRDPGRRHTPAGLHDRIVDRLRPRRPTDRSQRRRFDAVKHRSLPVGRRCPRGSARARTRTSAGWAADEDWALRAKNATGDYHAYIDKLADPDAVGASGRPTYAQVIGAVDRNQQPGDYVLAAAGGFPGELINGWRAKEVGDFDCEYGFSCMGYEISGAWGAKMARPNDEVITFVGDGSYMMMNSDLYSSVLSGHKLIVIVCDNGGFAVINRLQINQGGEPFNNQIENTRHRELVYVDFAAHAAAMGCNSERAATVHELESALRTRTAQRPHHGHRSANRCVRVDGGGAFWEVGVPEVSDRPQVQAAKAAMVSGLQQQRIGT